LIQLIKEIRDLIEEIPKFGADSRKIARKLKSKDPETQDCYGAITQGFKLNLVQGHN
jgi:hypothetical protein